MWGIFIYMDITSFGVDCFIVGILLYGSVENL